MATEFQKSVWEALRKIPRGRVTTYGEIARYIGRPNAVRAVGSAVARNPDVPATPCHRVVPATGRIGNYSGEGGTEGKIRLLREEGVEIEGNSLIDLVDSMYRF